MPHQDILTRFEEACVETVRLNPDAWGFSYCNEPNNPREWPVGDFQLTPAYYVASYNRLYRLIPQYTRFAPAAIDPTNAGWGDWREVWGDVLEIGLLGAEFLGFHAYCHGPNLSFITHDRVFEHAPLAGVFYDLRMLESQQEIVPARFAALPQVVLETNHLFTRDLDEMAVGWLDSGEWVRAAYDYFAGQGVAGACLFRFNHDVLRFGDKARVLEALRTLE